MEIMINTVAAIAAALFSYLGWVQLVQTSVEELEEQIERYYDENVLSDKNSNYILKPYSIRIKENDSFVYKCRRIFIPNQPVEGQTKILLNIQKGHISTRLIEIMSKKHTEIECSMTDVGSISVTISKTKPEQVLEKMAEFSDILSAVLGDQESTISSDLDYMFEGKD